ncbi:MAG: hypothetical protein R6X34_25385 [Chloroflexota bacterium]
MEFAKIEIGGFCFLVISSGKTAVLTHPLVLPPNLNQTTAVSQNFYRAGFIGSQSVVSCTPQPPLCNTGVKMRERPLLVRSV